jgi:uncharacterized protein (DUF1778 family)
VHVTEPENEKAQPSVAFQIDWPVAADVSTQHVNQFTLSPGLPTNDGTPDGIYLELGHLAPPVIRPGTDPATMEKHLSVQMLGRFHFSKERLDELIASLQEVAQNYEKIRRAARTEEQ